MLYRVSKFPWLAFAIIIAFGLTSFAGLNFTINFRPPYVLRHEFNQKTERPLGIYRIALKNSSSMIITKSKSAEKSVSNGGPSGDNDNLTKAKQSERIEGLDNDGPSGDKDNDNLTQTKQSERSEDLDNENATVSTERPENHHRVTTERIEADLGPFIVNNTAKYVDNSSKPLYPVTINRSYLIENPNLCSSVNNLTALVIVHTAPTHFDAREHIRRTWTNDTYFKNTWRLRVLFLLGRVTDVNTQKKIEQEFKEHQDILQGDFIDAYTNLTHKGVMAYKWISERCRNAKLILKVDDDIVVNTFKFFSQYVPLLENTTKHIVCKNFLTGTIPILRDSKTVWDVDRKQFEGFSFYPRYCWGFLVIFTNDVIPAIYRSTTVTPFFWVDDVYLYGLAPGRVPGIHYTGLESGTVSLSTSEALACYRNSTRICDYFVVGIDRMTDIHIEVWNHMVQRSNNEKQYKSMRILI